MLLTSKKPYEIGSHFALIDTEIIPLEEKVESWLPENGDISYTFSGRAAIEYALKDILHSEEIKNVYMPLYCCTSMTQPFLDKGINVVYYNVFFNPDKGIVYELDTSMDCDVFFAMSYFGLEEPMLNHAMKVFSSRGAIIIEDITHRLLCNISYSSNVDYSIASIRKWLPIPSGGYIVKHNGLLLDKPSISSDHIVLHKIDAMKEKYLFLKGKNISKESYLEKFAKFEKKLGKINSDYKIDNLSLEIIQHIDIEKVRIQRRKNGKVLYKGLLGLDFIKMLIPNPDFGKNCPLFIPIMISGDRRDSLREYLITHKVYCPVHWPNKKGSIVGIQENELSLICDQRYTEKDMEYVLELIRQWHKKMKENSI